MKVYLMYLRAHNSRSSSLMPLGILYLAAVLRTDGFEVKVFDTLFENLKNALDDIKRFAPELVGISFLSTEYKLCKEWVPVIREIVPKATIFGGGAHISSLRDLNAVSDLGLDFAVFGEGENTALQVCRSFREEKDFCNINGIIWKNDNEMQKNPPMPLIDNLDTIPFPARDLLRAEKYFTPPGFIRGNIFNGTLTIFTSRGCPSQCVFCDSFITFGRKVRRRSVSNVIHEIEDALIKFNIDSIWFADDTFTLDHNWVHLFCEEISKLNIAWGCQARVSTVNEELLCHMKKAGCCQVDYGVESGSDRVLRAMKKGQKAETVIKAFEATRKAGLRSLATMMVGFPEEKMEDIHASIRLVKKIKPNYLGVSILTPYPGTELWNVCVENGWVDEKNLSESGWDIHHAEEPLLHVNFPAKELLRLRNKLQNANFIRNYAYALKINNIKYIVNAMLASFKYPFNTFKVLLLAIETRNIDVLRSYFANVYQAHYLKSRRKLSVVREFLDVKYDNPNYIP